MKTQAQWLEHLKRFVPRWQFEDGSKDSKFNLGVFNAVAAIFSELESEADEHITETFIMQSSAPIIDLHGDERGKTRASGELTPPFAMRVQRITNTSDKVDIKAAVDALLVRGECTIFEAPADSPYLSRGVYLNRNAVLMDMKRNYFLISVPSQAHAPWSSLGRDAYASRGAYLGSEVQLSQAYINIIAAVNDMKAFGVMYGIVEKSA